jgi:plastocyanin
MRFRVIMGIGVSLFMSACSDKSDPTGPATTTTDVYTPGLVFSPSFITITVGSTIRFNISGDQQGHDVTFAEVAGAPASIPVTVNAVIARTFNAKGTFPFDCRTHPGMSGSVTVE